MSEIVETLAREMCVREGRNPDQVVAWPVGGGLRWRQWEEDAKEAIRSLEALGIPAATLAGLRDGSLVAVPREPTPFMVNRGLEGAYIDWRAASEDEALSDDEVKRIWAAMLAAAKEPGHE